MHVLLSKCFFGPGQQSSDRTWAKAKRRGEFRIAEPFGAQENQGHLVRFERAERLPHARPLFGLFQHLMGSRGKTEYQTEGFIAGPPPVFLQLVQSQPQSCAV